MLKKLLILIASLFSGISIAISFNSIILPDYLLNIILIFYLIILLLILILITRKNKILSILSIILMLIVIFISIILSFIFIRSNMLINKITNIDNEIDNYVVVVSKESNYNCIEDINNKEIGIINTNDINYTNALNNLKNIININTISYDNVLLLSNNLINKDIDVILINYNYISILDEGIDNFSDKIKIIYTIGIDIEDEKEEEEIVSNTNNNSFNIYISGIDTYGSINTVSRSDVNIIVSVNLDTGKILLTNIPRDMYVPLYGKEGLNDKLTHAGVYGINTSIKTIENFLDIKIDYYIRINFNSLISLVDCIGGIDVYSDYDFKAGNRYYYKGLNSNLSGIEALYFSRNRYSFSDGDRQRGRNQEKVIEAIIDKVSEYKDINTYINILSILENSFQTNMNKDTINNFINMQVDNNYNWEVISIDINGYDSMNYTYSYPWQKLYVMEVDNNSLEYAKDKINSILYE